MPYEKVGKNEPVCIADEVPFEIPESWEWVRLGTICTKLVDGDHNPPKGCISKTEYIMASSTNINNDTIVELEKVRYLTPEIFQKENERTKVESGDIFFTSVGSLGRSCVYTGGLNICFQRSVSVITTLIFNYYLKYCLDSGYIQQKIIREATGTAQKGFYLNQLSTVLIPVPPEKEQYKIVEQYEKIAPFLAAYSEVEQKTKILNAEFPELLKKSILQEAVQGKLVPQDPTDEPASVILERIRTEKERLIQEGKIKRDKHESVIYRRDNSHYEKLDGAERCIDDEIPFEIPETWAWCRLGQLTKLITKGSSPQWQGVSYTDKQNGILFITSENVGVEELLLSKEKYVGSEFNAMHPSSILRKGDLLTNIVGASIGRTAKYVLDILDANINQAVCIIRLVDLELSEYLVKYLNSVVSVDMMTNKSVDSARANLSLTSVSNLLVPIPPLTEQERIIGKIQFMQQLFKKP